MVMLLNDFQLVSMEVSPSWATFSILITLIHNLSFLHNEGNIIWEPKSMVEGIA